MSFPLKKPRTVGEALKKRFPNKDLSTSQPDQFQKDDSYTSLTPQGSKRFQIPKSYVDMEFPANDHNLYGGNDERRKEWGPCVWLRPEEIYGPDFSLFRDEISPDDIQQGSIGDCYLLSPISAVAQLSQLIKQIFVNKTINEEGKYSLNLYIDGELKTIVIDDLLPCQKSTKKPLTRSNGNELWVLLLEKALAKIAGSYNAIYGGFPAGPFYNLTGAPTETFYINANNKEMIWDILKKFKSFAACGSKNFKEPFNQFGIVRNHAYTIFNCYEEILTRRRWVKLRNPWGRQEWNGLGADENDDGIFKMPYDEFDKHFNLITTCHYKQTNKYTSLKCHSFPDEIKVFPITITKEGEYFFTIHRKPNSPVCMLIAHGSLNDERESFFIKDGIDQQVWLRGNFEAGTYVLCTQVKSPSNFPSEFVLSSYGPAETTISEGEFRQEIGSQILPKLEELFCYDVIN